MGGLNRSVYSNRIIAWFKGIRLLSLIAQDSSGPNSMVVKARFIIEPLFSLPGLIIAPYLLFRIRLYSSTIIFRGSASFLCVVSGFYIGLYILKLPKRITLLCNSSYYYISSIVY